MTAWLLTWFWQGSVLATGVAIALQCVPRRNAATRHLIWASALVAVAWLGWASSPFGGTASAPVAGEPIYIPSAPDVLISVFVGIWSAIALIRLLRILPALRAVYALRDACRPFPPDLASRLPLWLETNARGRRAELMICDRVPGASVLGFHRPYIAISLSLVDALSITELDQVILHEHAHVQRRDDWWRLGQTLLMSILWVHPAAVLVSRALNREREMACDEWVVARTGSPKQYARCLARVADVRTRLRRGPMLLPALLGTRHELVRRVDRVLGMGGKARRNVSAAAAVLAACGLAFMTLQLQTVRGFSEIADIVLPHVPRPVFSSHRASGLAPVPRPASDRPIARTTVDAPVSPSNPVSPSIPAASTSGPALPAESEGLPVELRLSARVFAGAYSSPSQTAAAPADRANPWRAMGTPGLEIASVARKTSVGLAGVFSRAGVALGRSF